MSYIRRKGYGLMGLGGAESCGGNQQWDPNCNFNGIVGQCVPVGTIGKAPGCTYAAPSSSGPSTFDKIFGAAADIFKAKVTPAPVTNVTTVGGGGMSTTGKLALVGAGVVVVALLMKKRG